MDEHDPYADYPDLLLTKPKASKLFGFQWSSGFVSPFRITKNIEILLELLETDIKVTNQTKICDLGCGDGIVLIEVCKKFNCKGIGFDLDENLIKEASNKSEEENLNIQLIHKDFLTIQESDLEGVNIIYMYLLPEALKKIEKIIKQFLFTRNYIFITNTFELPLTQEEIDENEIQILKKGLFTTYSFPSE